MTHLSEGEEEVDVVTPRWLARRQVELNLFSTTNFFNGQSYKKLAHFRISSQLYVTSKNGLAFMVH